VYFFLSTADVNQLRHTALGLLALNNETRIYCARPVRIWLRAAVPTDTWRIL